jgi:hypothetical protein
MSATIELNHEATAKPVAPQLDPVFAAAVTELLDYANGATSTCSVYAINIASRVLAEWRQS